MQTQKSLSFVLFQFTNLFSCQLLNKYNEPPKLSLLEPPMCANIYCLASPFLHKMYFTAMVI